MSEPAVRAVRVTKRFPRYRAAVPYGTLKSDLVELVRRVLVGTGPRAGAERFDVLRDVSFEIARGETVGIVGRNGAGKSTLLRILAGILRPDEGRVEVRGRAAALVDVGAGFHPELSGRENVLVNGIVLGLTRREVRERLGRIVEFAGVGEFLDAPVRTYSTGMYLRLGFSTALHAAPDVLLVDEVLAVGDEAFRAKCLDALAARVRDGNATTVVVSHELDLVARTCGRVVVLDPPHAVVFDDARAGVARARELILP